MGEINLKRDDLMIDTKGMNTKQVVEIAKDYAEKNGIKDIVVATTKGEMGIIASEIFGKEYNLVIVTHITGFRENNIQELSEENKAKILRNGANVFTGTMIFHNLNDHIRAKGYYTMHNIIADTLRLFGQGAKVTAEIVMMAADAGLIEAEKDVIAIAGTGRGADTVMLIKSANSRRMFDLKFKEIIAKPKNW